MDFNPFNQPTEEQPREPKPAATPQGNAPQPFSYAEKAAWGKNPQPPQAAAPRHNSQPQVGEQRAQTPNQRPQTSGVRTQADNRGPQYQPRPQPRPQPQEPPTESPRQQPEQDAELARHIPKYLTKHKISEEDLVKDVNPQVFTKPKEGSRFFVIKSYSEEDVHRAIKYSVWSSSNREDTERGRCGNNDSMDAAYKEVNEPTTAATDAGSDPKSPTSGPAFLKGPMVYLLFSVNGSGHFCGVARLASHYYPKLNAGVWCKDNWKGLFYIRWLYVKDVPHTHLRHIRLANNYNKPVTNTRDGHEVDYDDGARVLDTIHNFRYTTALFDDYDHYDRLEKEKYRRQRQTSSQHS